ncbi:MAG: glutamine synthetase, partial [Methylococcales bacterium]|nr:glutamine synthetase [Methylococcales bacterium]
MDPREVNSVEDACHIVKERQLSHIKVGLFDVDGVLRGKYISKEKFFSALENGFGFCDVVLGWDIKDQLVDNLKYTGWHTGYPDASVRIIPESCRELPFEDNGLFFLCEFTGEAQQICPRQTLHRVLNKAKDMGFEAMCSFEYEFFVFDETAQSIREKQFKNLSSIQPSDFGYSVIRNSVETEFYQDLLELAEVMDFGLEGLHEETGPGVLEAAITYDTASSSADKAAMFKTFSKIMAQRQQRMITFMAKWSPDYPGQSGHIHISLKDLNGKPLFFDETKENNMSDLMRHFVAGQQKLMPEL